MYWLSHMSLWGRFFTSYGLQMVEKNFLKEIIWLFDVSIEFTYRNQVLENIQTLQVKKKASICTQSVKNQNCFIILTHLFYPFQQNSENRKGRKLEFCWTTKV